MVIGIGAGTDPASVRATMEHLSGIIPLRCFTHPDNRDFFSGFDAVYSPVPEEALVQALFSGGIDAAVRGSLPSNSTLSALKRVAGVPCLERIAFLETADGIRFLLAPVGVDEGWTVDEKVSLIARAQRMAPAFGVSDRAAVLSGGRLGDVGRHPVVDRTITDAEEVAARTGADHAEILIESAVSSHGIIIAPDGISGNLIFRTLCLLGGGIAHGAPVANIDRIYVDTSRASSDYSNSVFIANSLFKK
ncbi:methanogenesis marker protein Mmp4/MtxX [Methanogenium sp. S4BF]|uniref:methanogenesis marker protein Mmp4/MtxX n=1 Tax=Methanogenium sp. S4BF TaxID=1789226 RepID=UPI002417785A|nr:methanogenesis marker protein Mmp4/MtxX [Methanogenium sp. S4BF]WFN33525.1 methanogenesis marker protein Mmp4/MtxX [Methanogenium sp. S4BF]